MNTIVLKPDRGKSALLHHPWIFSNAIASISDETQPGETVLVKADDGKLLGFGAYSPHSQIMVRIWTFDPQEEIDSLFFYNKLKQAIRARDTLLKTASTSAYRLVNAESDGLPGLVVDRYADFLVCQFLSVGSEHWKNHIIAQLSALLPGINIYERSDAEIRSKEGLPQSKGVLLGESPPDILEIYEGPCRFLVDIQNGHKTGFYLDQRENRAQLLNYTMGKNVLNCFSYTGSFSLFALKGGAASVTNIESSPLLLELSDRQVALNGFEKKKITNERGDVFHLLRKYRDSRRQFDIIILDPPKFVSSKAQIQSASRGYKDINLLAFKLLNPGGILFTFSCSEHMHIELFQKIVADAALDAGCYAQIIGRLSQAADHPTALHFPEGWYLKGLICKIPE